MNHDFSKSYYLKGLESQGIWPRETIQILALKGHLILGVQCGGGAVFKKPLFGLQWVLNYHRVLNMGVPELINGNLHCTRCWWRGWPDVSSSSPSLTPRQLARSTMASLGFPSLLLEKAMAPHSSTLAWKIPWAEEPGIISPAQKQWENVSWRTWRKRNQQWGRRGRIFSWQDNVP